MLAAQGASPLGAAPDRAAGVRGVPPRRRAGHGGLDGFDHVGRALANAAGHTVVSVNDRLAPEHPFPAGLEDARAALAWAGGPGAAGLGSEPRRVVVGGDSAGANLATVAA